MKYTPSQYAKAFLDVKPDAKLFLEVVRKNGDFNRIDQILQALEDAATIAHGGQIVDIEFARNVDPSHVKKLTSKFGAKDLVRISTNASLVAGTRITINHERELDGSLQRKLQKAFPTQ